MTLLSLLVAATAGGLWGPLTHDQEHASQHAEIPQSVAVHVFSLKDNPQVVSYDPTSFSFAKLTEFAQDLCNNAIPRIEVVTPFLLQRIRGWHRVHIYC